MAAGELGKTPAAEGGRYLEGRGSSGQGNSRLRSLANHRTTPVGTDRRTHNPARLAGAVGLERSPMVGNGTTADVSRLPGVGSNAYPKATALGVGLPGRHASPCVCPLCGFDETLMVTAQARARRSRPVSKRPTRAPLAGLNFLKRSPPEHGGLPLARRVVADKGARRPHHAARLDGSA